MSNRPYALATLAAAFLAGQIAMLGIVSLLRPTAAQARADGNSVSTESIFVRKGASGAGIQITATGASGGPGLTFFDSDGASRMQLNLDATGKPTVLLREKSGDIAIGLGIEGEDKPTIAIRSAKSGLLTIPIPDK